MANLQFIWSAGRAREAYQLETCTIIIRVHLGLDFKSYLQSDANSLLT